MGNIFINNKVAKYNSRKAGIIRWSNRQEIGEDKLFYIWILLRDDYIGKI